MSLEIGSDAPDFTLRDENGADVTLSELRGRDVLLVFSPIAFSAICTKELHDITALKSSFDDASAEICGISVGHPFALEAFKDAEGIAAHLLADFEPKGEVARKYDVYLDQIAAATRGTFVIVRDGKIAHKVVEEVGSARKTEFVYFVRR